MALTWTIDGNELVLTTDAGVRPGEWRIAFELGSLAFEKDEFVLRGEIEPHFTLRPSGLGLTQILPTKRTMRFVKEYLAELVGRPGAEIIVDRFQAEERWLRVGEGAVVVASPIPRQEVAEARWYFAAWIDVPRDVADAPEDGHLYRAVESLAAILAVHGGKAYASIMPGHRTIVVRVPSEADSADVARARAVELVDETLEELGLSHGRWTWSDIQMRPA